MVHAVHPEAQRRGDEQTLVKDAHGGAAGLHGQVHVPLVGVLGHTLLNGLFVEGVVHADHAPGKGDKPTEQEAELLPPETVDHPKQDGAGGHHAGQDKAVLAFHAFHE